MARHELKTWPEYFEAILAGAKTFEIRQNDRDFHVGDWLVLREWSEDAGYSGRVLYRRVGYMLRGMGLQPGYVCMALEND